MLDHFAITHKSGLVLWSRSFTPAFSALTLTPASPVSTLIKDVFIEGKQATSFDGHNGRWDVDNELGLVFVVVFPALLRLSYIPTLLSRVKELFLALFRPLVQSLVESLASTSIGALNTLREKIVEEKWDQIFDRCLRGCEEAEEPKKAPQPAHTQTPSSPRIKSTPKHKTTPSHSTTPTTAKLMRKWGNSSVSAEDMATLDYSPQNEHTQTRVELSTDAMGSRTKNGEYVLADFQRKDLLTEADILASGSEAPQPKFVSFVSRLSGRILTKDDVAPVLRDMERHLMSKNVAKDIAEKLCEAVEASLIGKKLGGLKSIKSEVHAALSSSLTRVLAPKTSTDLLPEIKQSDVYAITFVGVNGVGKSTNLSKVCFWLLQNGLRVLIAACDTFRSGAVEQLRVHVRNLGQLHEGMVELYERGYGKDAAGIAKDAIAYAKGKFDVVLIDTAGRMQDNEPLMRSLAKLVTVNNPDKIVFVGEALVGNEAVDQLVKFDRSLKDFSKRGIDGILLTKFDTIDDKVGAALSMTYVTGQPILFVGCGQTYTDLRHLRADHIVQALLSS